jgi:hypothetical protein
MNKNHYHNKTIDDDCDEDSDEGDCRIRNQNNTPEIEESINSNYSLSDNEINQIPYNYKDDNSQISKVENNKSNPDNVLKINSEVNNNSYTNNTYKSSTKSPRKKQRRFESYFSTIEEINEHFHKFYDYKEGIIKTMQNDINYMQSKIFTIYTKYTEIFTQQIDEYYEISVTEDETDAVTKEMGLEKRTKEEIIKLMYIFSLIIYNIGDKYLESFISQKKNYDKSREKYINEVVNLKIAANYLSINNINTIISQNTNKSNSNNKNIDNISGYYKSLYNSGLHSQLASLFNNNYNLKTISISKQSENKNKDKNPTINQSKSNTSTNGIHVKNSNCDKNSNSEDNNSSNICSTIQDKNNTYLKKIKDTEEKFIKNLSNDECDEILSDTFTACEFMCKLIESSVDLFSDLIFLYHKECSIEIEEFSKVFLEEFLFGIKQDPFFKVG